jgi:competence protein ComEC
VLSKNFRERSGEAFILAVYSSSWIENLGPGEVNPLIRFALSLRVKMESVIDETMPEPESFFLKSVLLGKRHILPAETRDTLSEIGAGHFLAVSGLHAGLVLFFLMTMAGLAGFSERGVSLFSISGLVLFCLMTGARVSTVRAVILAVVMLSGGMLGRRPDRWSALSLAAILVLAFKPEELFSPGFRLSFTAVAGIFYLYPVFAGLRPSWGKASFLQKPVLGLLSVHLAVIPLIGLSYGYVPAVSPVANLLLIPLLSLSAALGLAAGILGMVHLFPAHVINAANWALIRVVLGAAGVFRRAPGLVYFDGFPEIFVLFYYAGLLLLPFALRRAFPLKGGF